MTQEMDIILLEGCLTMTGAPHDPCHKASLPSGRRQGLELQGCSLGVFSPPHSFGCWLQSFLFGQDTMLLYIHHWNVSPPPPWSWFYYIFTIKKGEIPNQLNDVHKASTGTLQYLNLQELSTIISHNVLDLFLHSLQQKINIIWLFLEVLHILVIFALQLLEDRSQHWFTHYSWTQLYPCQRLVNHLNFALNYQVFINPLLEQTRVFRVLAWLYKQPRFHKKAYSMSFNSLHNWGSIFNQTIMGFYCPFLFRISI